MDKLRFLSIERTTIKAWIVAAISPILTFERRANAMREFRMLVNDDRPGRSDFSWVQTNSEMRARDIAEQTFRATPHHIGVELWS